MYKKLPFFLIVCIISTVSLFLFSTQPASAQTPKKFSWYWQTITLNKIISYYSSPSNFPQNPSPKITPTATPTSKPMQKLPPSIIITITPSPTKTSPTNTPSPTSSSNASSTPTSDVQTYIMKEINDYRASQGLPTVQTNDQTCNFAKTRAQEITTNFNHDGFQKRIDTKTLPYAHWTKVTENIAMTSDYKQVVTMWKNSSGHAANMRAETPFVCVERSGNYYAYEGMKP